MKGEERAYDNRLLMRLLGQTRHLIEEPKEAAHVAAHWEDSMAALEAGLPIPTIAERGAAGRQAAEDAEDAARAAESGVHEELWMDAGEWLTSMPPPPGFDRYENGRRDDSFYERELSEAEEEA